MCSASYAYERLDQSSFIFGRISMASSRYLMARPKSMPPMWSVAICFSSIALRSSSNSWGLILATRCASSTASQSKSSVMRLAAFSVADCRFSSDAKEPEIPAPVPLTPLLAHEMPFALRFAAMRAPMLVFFCRSQPSLSVSAAKPLVPPIAESLPSVPPVEIVACASVAPAKLRGRSAITSPFGSCTLYRPVSLLYEVQTPRLPFSAGRASKPSMITERPTSDGVPARADAFLAGSSDGRGLASPDSHSAHESGQPAASAGRLTAPTADWRRRAVERNSFSSPTTRVFGSLCGASPWAVARYS